MAATIQRSRCYECGSLLPRASAASGHGLLGQILQYCEQALEEKLKQKIELLVEPSTDPSVVMSANLSAFQSIRRQRVAGRQRWAPVRRRRL